MSVFEKYRKSVVIDRWNMGMLFNLYVVDLSANIENQLGVKRTITYNNNAFVKLENEKYRIEVVFEKVSNNGESIMVDDKTLDKLNRILFSKNEPLDMQIGDLHYYVVPIEGSVKKTNDGYVTVVLESVSPYVYGNICVLRKKVVDISKEIEINNNGINDIYCDLEIQGVGDILIKNMSNGNIIELINLNNEDIKLIGDTSEILGIDYDRVKGNLKDALKLRYGSNRFQVEVTGNITIQFTFQIEYALT